MRYEVLFEKGRYALIVRKESLDEYAVVSGLNKETGEWAHTCGYWYFGRYASMTKVNALQHALDYFRCKTEENYISRLRLEELATLFMDGLIEDDRESAMEYFENECEMESYEMKFFGMESEEEE